MTITPEKTPVRPARVIAMAAQKGGVGKTTSTINLGAALAEYGRKVLLIDLDPSGQITDALNLRPEIGADLASVILGKSDASPADLVTRHSSGLDIITWHPNMITLAENLYSKRARERRLARVVKAYADAYDYILIDFAPTLGILTDSGLMASDNGDGTGAVIFPVEASKLMHGTLDLMLAQVEQLEDVFERKFTRLGMICGNYNAMDGKATQNAFTKLMEQPFPMIGVVKRRTLFKEAMEKGLTIFQHAPNSDAADMFRNIAKEIDA